MRRWTTLAALAAALVLASSAGALAADVADVANGVSVDGYYVEFGAAADEAALADIVDLADREGVRLGLVVLADQPVEGTENFADTVLDLIQSGTVAVVSPVEVGAKSTEFTDSEIRRALDRFTSAYDGSPSSGFAAFADELLTGAPAVTTTVPSDDGGGSSVGLFILLAIVGGLIALVVFSVRRSGRQEREKEESRFAEAKAEIQSQLDALANGILELTDRVRLSESAEADGYFDGANEAYASAVEELEGLTSLNDLEALSDRLNRARWQLEATRAVLEGRPVPPEPAEHPPCFFDPTHGAGTEEAVIETAAGRKTVGVCRADAEKLRQGQRPEPRTITVDGRQIPAPQAPRSYGGGGFDWLDAFSLVVGGASSIPYDWGRGARASRRRRTSGFGFPTRRRSAPARTSRARTSRARTSGRSRSTRSRGGGSRRLGSRGGGRRRLR